MPLGKKADAGDYVKDFYKSKAPQFKGKSKNKRRQMAIAAYLDARDKGKAKSEEMTFKVEVDGLPAMYIDGNSPGQVKNHLRKLIKQPSMIKGVSRMTKYDVKKTSQYWLAVAAWNRIDGSTRHRIPLTCQISMASDSQE